MSSEPTVASGTGEPIAAEAAGRGLRHGFRALHHRDFALFWSAALVSNVGTWMQNVTVPYVLFHLTGSAAWVGLAAFAQFLPMMLLSSVGGVLADRFERRRILLLTNVGQAAIALALWGVWQSGNARPAVLVGLVALIGVTAGIGVPAWQSFVVQLVPRESLLNAITLNSAQFNAARALGPTVGGVVLASGGPGWAFLANSLSYLVVIAALMAVRARQPQHPRSGHGAWTEFRAGLSYARRSRGVRVAVVMVFAGAFLGSPVVQLAPVFARDVFHVGPAAYGLLASGMGAGAVMGAVLVGGYGDAVPRSRLAVRGMAVFAVAAVGFGVAPGFALGLAALVVLGGGYLVLISALNTSLQLMVPDELRGRVLAVYFMAFSGGFPLGALAQGALADAVGPRATAVAAGAFLLAFAGLVAARGSLVVSLDEEAAHSSLSAV